MARSATAHQARTNSVSPASSDPVIDRDHLALMTFGDHDLERELLQLFDTQAAVLIVRMRAGGADAIAPLAHTLKGSAAGIGATRVMRAAQAAEMAPSDDISIARLTVAVEEARAEIATLLAKL